MKSDQVHYRASYNNGHSTIDGSIWIHYDCHIITNQSIDYGFPFGVLDERVILYITVLTPDDISCYFKIPYKPPIRT